MAYQPKNSGLLENTVLPFDRQIGELEELVREANGKKPSQKKPNPDAIRDSEAQYLSAWQRVELARHGQRPRMLDYTTRIFDDLLELHGDRALGDDLAMVTGLARFNGQTVVVVGQQKGVSTEEKVERNFGMAHPQGYRKAMRMYDMAERFQLPVISFVDTPAAHPGVEAEMHGQGPAIAQAILHSLRVRTPVFSVILGEGGSGGALAIAVADHIAMFEHAFYVICPPERCAEILWRDVGQKELAASALRLTARDLHDLGVIDSILPEPGGGAHKNPDAAAQVLAEELERFLSACKRGAWTPDARQRKFRAMGVWYEQVLDAEEAEAVE